MSRPGWPASPIRKWPRSIDASIEEGLKTPGASDVTAAFRDGPRKVQFEGATYLRPTIVLCDSFAHPLANREFLFPYASVVTVAQAEMLRQNRAVPGRYRHHQGPGVYRTTFGVAPDRTPQPRPHLHPQRFLGPAARRQPV